MGRLNELTYAAGKVFSRCVYALGIRGRVLRGHIPERPGGYVLAVTHLSHLEPFVVTSVLRRKVDWMARIEFYRWRPFAWVLYAMDSFPVDRFGVPVSSIRTAIARAKAGRVVGIFPEGGVATGRESACRGGPIKQGACLVALRAGVPIVPCVVLGTHTLNEVGPWLPFGRAKLWIAFGEPIEPVTGETNRKASRRAMSRELGDAFCALYQELCERYKIPDNSIP